MCIAEVCAASTYCIVCTSWGLRIIQVCYPHALHLALAPSCEANLYKFLFIYLGTRVLCVWMCLCNSAPASVPGLLLLISARYLSMSVPLQQLLLPRSSPLTLLLLLRLPRLPLPHSKPPTQKTLICLSVSLSFPSDIYDWIFFFIFFFFILRVFIKE